MRMLISSLIAVTAVFVVSPVSAQTTTTGVYAQEAHRPHDTVGPRIGPAHVLPATTGTVVTQPGAPVITTPGAPVVATPVVPAVPGPPAPATIVDSVNRYTAERITAPQPVAEINAAERVAIPSPVVATTPAFTFWQVFARNRYGYYDDAYVDDNWFYDYYQPPATTAVVTKASSTGYRTSWLYEPLAERGMFNW
jgi:hypothetical protein